MILVVILVVAWLAILGPGLMRRRAGHGDGVGSISHFHRQLRVLEHSGAEPIVLPAYRLHSVDGGPTAPGSRYPDVASVPVLTVVGADRLPRPALAFLGDDPAPTVPAPTRESVPTDRHPGAGAASTYRLPDPEQRSLARRRRRDTLMVLLLATVLTFLIGLIPGAGVAWMVTAVSGVALVAYVGMLVHLRSMAQERERKLHPLRPAASVGSRRPFDGAPSGDDRYGFDGFAYDGNGGHDDRGRFDERAVDAVYGDESYDRPARHAVAR